MGCQHHCMWAEFSFTFIDVQRLKAIDMIQSIMQSRSRQHFFQISGNICRWKCSSRGLKPRNSWQTCVQKNGCTIIVSHNIIHTRWQFQPHFQFLEKGSSEACSSKKSTSCECSSKLKPWTALNSPTGLASLTNARKLNFKATEWWLP